MKISKIEVMPIHPERWGDDMDVVDAARVSFDKIGEWEDEDSRLMYVDSLVNGGQYLIPDPGFKGELKAADARLIQYLAKHKHFSPFNHSFLKFRVKAPILVARQMVKHKFMPWNEVSRRYVDEEPEFYIPDIRVKADNVKQGSGGIHEDAMNLAGNIEDHCRESLRQYNWLLADNVAPEVARCVLPQNMMTEWIWSGTLGAFLDMLVLRLDSHTQKESRDVAELIAIHVKEYFPVSFNSRIN